MPYIANCRRMLLGSRRSGKPVALAVNQPATVGELTYLLTRELNDYLVQYVERHGGLSYAVLGECITALEGARADFDRRILAPYEDQAIERNGDVWSRDVLSAAVGP